MESNSQFEQYFDSDYAPTTAEILEINKLIDDRQAIVSDIDVRIAELDRMRRELEQQRFTHSKFIARHRNLTTAVRVLPADVLFAIFLALHAMSTPLTVPHPSVAISHVCHQWRRLSLAVPLLWTHTNLSTQSPMPHDAQTSSIWAKQVRSICERATTFFSRAGTHPQHMAMVVRDSLDTIVPEQYMQGDMKNGLLLLKELLPTICAASCHFSFRVSTTTPMSLCIILLMDSLKKADKLTMSIDYLKPEPIARALWEDLGNTIPLEISGLTSLNLKMLPLDLRLVEAAWDTLTDLTLGPTASDRSALRVEDVMPIIIQTVNLVQLSLEFQYSLDRPPMPVLPHRRVHLFNLQTLHIRSNIVPTQFAKSLDTPSLTNLSIASYNTSQEQHKDLSALVAFLHGCAHQLTDLTYDYHDFDRHVLSYVLGLLPNVEALQLTSSHRPITPRGASAILETLLATPSQSHAEQTDPSLVPKLRRLVCDLDEATPDVRDGVLGFIEARRSGEREGEPVRWLEEVDVRFNKGSVGGMLEELRDRGVKTTLVQFRTLGL